jgi:hypothetical protein
MTYLADNNYKHLMLAMQAVIISAAALTLSACGSTPSRPQKYEGAHAADQTKAVVIVGTKNVSYFDLHRYEPATTAQPTATPVAITPAAPVATVAANTKQPIGACCEEYAPANTSDGVESADPTKLDYTNSSFNLRYLFNSKSPSNLGQEREQDRKREEQQLEKDCNPAAPKCNNNSSSNTAAPAAPAQPLVAEYRIHKPSYLFNVFNYTKATYTIEPGIYYISFAFYEHNHNVNFTRKPGISKTGVVQYGAFEVKAGEVLYLGDVDFDWVNIDKPKMIHIVNNFNDVTKDLIASDHRDLAVKIEPAQFYPHGALISSNEAGTTISLP